MLVSFGDQRSPDTDILVIPVFDGGTLGSAETRHWDQTALDGFLASQIRQAPGFTGKRGQTEVLTAPEGSGAKRIVLLGMGKAEDLDKKAAELLGGPLHKALKKTGFTEAQVLSGLPQGVKITDEEFAAALAGGVLLKTYDFNAYKTDKKSKGIEELSIIVSDPAKADALFDPVRETAEGVFWAANLANTPPNKLYPETYAEEIRDVLEPLGVKVTVLDENDMQRLGMGAIYAVGKGSEHPPRMVIMEYDGTHGQEQRPFGLVGKGVTFDSGGLSLKSGAGMKGMKFDMGGSAAVVGAMRALAGRGAHTHVVAVVGLAENAPDGKSYRPDDVITALSGKTIEIGNTDAEGRLVMADCLTYLQNKYDPHTVMDLATLTGACMMALGHTFAGIMTNDDAFWQQIDAAGQEAQEPGWRLPLHKDFAKAMESKIADISNMANMRYAGASTAAEFLHSFIDRDENGHERRWAHVDMAGPGIPADGISKGFGVRLIERLIAAFYEKLPAAPKAPAPRP